MSIKELSFEEKVIIAMKRKKMTWQSLADELGFSMGYIRDIAQGRRDGKESLKHKEKIAEILEIK